MSALKIILSLPQEISKRPIMLILASFLVGYGLPMAWAESDWNEGISYEQIVLVIPVLNLAMKFQDWVSFFSLLYHYWIEDGEESSSLWDMYGMLSMAAWFFSRFAIVYEVHGLDFQCPTHALVLSSVHAFIVRKEARRVRIGAPLMAFLTTYIVEMHFLRAHFWGVDVKDIVMSIVWWILVWAYCSRVTRNPSRRIVCVLIAWPFVSLFLEAFIIYGYLPHALVHVSSFSCVRLLELHRQRR